MMSSCQPGERATLFLLHFDLLCETHALHCYCKLKAVKFGKGRKKKKIEECIFLNFLICGCMLCLPSVVVHVMLCVCVRVCLYASDEAEGQSVIRGGNGAIWGRVSGK